MVSLPSVVTPRIRKALRGVAFRASRETSARWVPQWLGSVAEHTADGLARETWSKRNVATRRLTSSGTMGRFEQIAPEACANTRHLPALPALNSYAERGGVVPSGYLSTANPRSEALEFQGLDSVGFLTLRGGIPRSIGSFPQF